jgi:hypothetical protein
MASATRLRRFVPSVTSEQISEGGAATALQQLWRSPDSTVIVSEQGHPIMLAIEPPWRYEDHYGFTRLSVLAC